MVLTASSGSARRRWRSWYQSATSGVDDLLGRVGLHYPAALPQSVDGRRHPVLPVVGQGQAHVGHVLALLAVQRVDLGPVVGVVLQQPPPPATGGHRRVLGRVADQAQGGAGGTRPSR